MLSMPSQEVGSKYSPVQSVLLITLLFAACKIFYNLYLHPLRKYPGPRLYSMSMAPYYLLTLRGTVHYKIKDFHDYYGDVVRLGPNMLVYRNAGAWKEIYGRKPGGGEFEKDPEHFYTHLLGINLLTAVEEDHTRMRRLLSHAFSNKALQEQEPILQGYLDVLIRRLRDFALSNTAIDITRWLNYTTFDTIGDLAMGETFNCLGHDSLHPWVEATFLSSKYATLLRPFINLIPPALVNIPIPENLKFFRNDNYRYTKEAVSRRLARDSSRPDFMSYILRHNDEKGMTRDEIESNQGILIVGGSETSATLLSGCCYYLLTHPEVYDRLVGEIRKAFQRNEDITLLATAKIPYLTAVLEESLRKYPPLAGINPRCVPTGGAVINGQFVPAGTSVSVGFLSAFQSSSNFAEPDSFIPERWLNDNDPRFKHDNKEAFQPFSYGPRNCLGRTMAYGSMRMILAQLLWNFDMSLEKPHNDWDHQLAFTNWEKPPLMLRLTAR
ncbi:benzoate 4-monooxygenase cytochrome P450 [Aspergillus ambiguus]|uniref:cytochrome P450 n=1 Tax=Aspergillus ambiguus TaxID=176160 RepID=UPI003CCDDFCA